MPLLYITLPRVLFAVAFPGVLCSGTGESIARSIYLPEPGSTSCHDFSLKQSTKVVPGTSTAPGKLMERGTGSGLRCQGLTVLGDMARYTGSVHI